MDPQKEIDAVPAAYEMERRILALKNVYAENVAQRSDPGHSAAGALAHALCGRKKIAISAEDRYHLIAIEAYFRAKRQNFDPRCVVQQWIEAETEVDRLLGGDEPRAVAPHHDKTLHGHE